MNKIKEAAIACWRLEKWLESANIERKMAAESSLRTLKEFLASNQVEIIDLTGKLYDQGLSVEVMYFEDEDCEEEKTPTIVEMMKPIILQSGQVIEFGQVVIAKNPKNNQDNIANGKNNKTEQNEAITDDNSVFMDNKTTNIKDGTTHKTFLWWIPSIVSVVLISIFLLTVFKNYNRINHTQNQLIESQKRIIEELSDINEKVTKNTGKDDNNKYGVSNANFTNIKWQSYVVKAGDNLTSICLNMNIDYSAYKTIICKVNDMGSENILYVGETIVLPIVDVKEDIHERN